MRGYSVRVGAGHTRPRKSFNDCYVWASCFNRLYTYQQDVTRIAACNLLIGQHPRHTDEDMHILNTSYCTQRRSLSYTSSGKELYTNVSTHFIASTAQQALADWALLATLNCFSLLHDRGEFLMQTPAA